MDGSLILPLWRSGEIDSLPDVLAEHATFCSPVTDYHGRPDAAHMLGLIARALDGVEKRGEWYGESETVCAFAARMQDDHVQGMLWERRDDTGRLVYVTLFLRPYRTLGRALDTMRELLAESPLPGSST